MTFAGDLKNELYEIVPRKKHCIIAECMGIMVTLGLIKKTSDNMNKLYVSTESTRFALKYFTLLKKAFNIEDNVSLVQTSIRDQNEILELNLDLMPTRMKEMIGFEENGFDLTVLENMVLHKKCCKRAFLRSVFIVGGSVADPQKSYYFEISTASLEQAGMIQRLIQSFGPAAKIIRRKAHFVVYLQDKESILDMVSIMESSRVLMDMENLCIIKEVRNNANRQTNCDNANIKRMVGAAQKQVEDIRYIVEVHGVGVLPENLREIAVVRLENQDLSLGALGELMDPPLGKSGVNHRLRKLSEMAEKLRNV